MANKLNTNSGLSGSNNTAIGSLHSSNNTLTLGNNVFYGNGHGSWGTTATIQSQKTIYIILGEEYEVNGYADPTLGMAIATLNVLGKPYWIELKNQNFTFGYDMDAFIEERITVLDRDKKINDILK